MPHRCSSNMLLTYLGILVVLLRWTPSGNRYDCHSSDIPRCFHACMFASPSVNLSRCVVGSTSIVEVRANFPAYAHGNATHDVRDDDVFIKDSALRWCHRVSIYNFTHVIRRNIMKSTLVHVSLNEITVSFQLCTMKDGAKSE